MNNNNFTLDRHYLDKCILSRSALCLLLFLVLGIAETKASASLYVDHWHQDYPFAASYNNRIVRSRRSLLSVQNDNLHHGLVVPAARKTTIRSPSFASDSFDRLRPEQKVVTGTVRVLTDALGDFIVGFCAAYAVGTVVGLPDFVFRPFGTGTSRLSLEIQGRLRRMNVRSLRWALSVGEVLGTFRGCDTAVNLIRYPRRDRWNAVYGCASAGAILARNREYDF